MDTENQSSEFFKPPKLWGVVSVTQVTWVQDLTFWTTLNQKKNSPYPQIASLPLNSYHLFNSCWDRARGLRYLSVSDRDRNGSEVKWLMVGYCEHCVLL